MLIQRQLISFFLLLVAGIISGGCNAGLTPDDTLPPTPWLRTFGGQWDDSARAMAMDSTGNIYITGVFSGDSDFDPGPAKDIRDAHGSQDIFLVKYDSSGEYEWVRTWCMGASVPEGMAAPDDNTGGVAVDSSGNVYVAGGYAVEDYDPLEYDYESIDADSFLRKFDSSGNPVWERKWGGDGQAACGGLAIDSAGNIYITGYGGGLIDLDPGEGEAIYGEEGASSTYISKFNPDGEFLWGFVFDVYFGSLDNIIATDSGRLYVSGTYNGTTDFMPGPGVAELTSNGSRDAFLCCFNTDGDFLWCLGWGSDEWDYSPSIYCDKTGSMYITGSYEGKLDLDPGPGVELHGEPDRSEAYLMKLNSNGDFQWARVWDSSDYIASRCISVAGNDIYVSGYFRGTGDFLPGPGEWNLGASDSSIYLTKFNTNGEFQLAYMWDVGDGFEYSTGIGVADSGYVYITGSFFVPLPPYYPAPRGSIPPWGYYDVFLLRYPPFAEL